MKNCSKVAVILHDILAIQLCIIGKAANKHVYLGRDSLNENLLGYRYHGYFPKTILQRAKLFHKSGIIDWWQNYFKWLLVMKTEAGQLVKTEAKNISSNESKTGVYILCLIPGGDLLVSTLSSQKITR